MSADDPSFSSPRKGLVAVEKASCRAVQLVFKIVPSLLWLEAETRGVFGGAPIDLADGFIHFSTAAQVEETAAKHFAGGRDLLLVAVDPDRLGAALRWEISRDVSLFPHLYAPLAFADVAWAKPLPLAPEGRHDFTGLLP